MFFRWAMRSRRRSVRFNNFFFNFYVLRFIKSLFSLYYFFLAQDEIKGTYANLVFRPNKININYYLKLGKENTLILGNKFHRKYYEDYGFNFCDHGLYYSTLNLYISYKFKNLLITRGIKKLYLTTDYGVDDFLAINICKKLKIPTVCIQHGFIPLEHLNDIDGFFCDSIVVQNYSQRSIIQDAGYTGIISVYQDLFSSTTQKPNYKSWLLNKNIIFIGPGYTDGFLRKSLEQLLIEVSELLKNDFNLIYRSHPRELYLRQKDLYFGFKVFNDDSSSILNSENIIFLGVKSTYMIQAQAADRIVILIENKKMPSYFSESDIHVRSELLNLKDIIYAEINKKYHV